MAVKRVTSSKRDREKRNRVSEKKNKREKKNA